MTLRIMVAAVVLQGAVAAVAAPPATLPAPVGTSEPTTRPYTARTLDEAYRELRARGFPATLDDLQQAGIPDDQNGATYLTRAGAGFVSEKPGPRNSSFEYGEMLPYPPEWFRLARESATANAASLALLPKARACGDRVSWDVKPGGAPADRMQQMLQGFGPLRALASVVGDTALLEHFDGNEAGAFETCRDARYLVEANAHRPFLISNLVTLALRSLVAQDYHLLGMSLQLADDVPGAKGKGVDRRVVKEAIAWLLDDAIQQEARRAMAQERVYVLVDAQANGYASDPGWLADLPELLTLYDELARQVGQPAWEPIHLTARPAGRFASLYETEAKSSERWRQAMYRIRITQQAAAVGLAAGMYHRDKGVYPESLQELVPEYLPVLPMDPYSRTGKPLMYMLLADGKRPRLGSVGPDDLDAGRPDNAPAEASYDMTFAKPGEAEYGWVDLAAWNSDAGR